MTWWICGGVTEQTVRTITGRKALKWCFRCRQRLEHTLVSYSEPFPSYWEPFAQWECPSCGEDRTHFGDGW